MAAPDDANLVGENIECGSGGIDSPERVSDIYKLHCTTTQKTTIYSFTAMETGLQRCSLCSTFNLQRRSSYRITGRSQQVAPLITTASRKCGLASLPLQRNNKCSYGIQGHPTVF
jgi:hypothetical protein